MSERRAPGWGSFYSEPLPPYRADDPPGARKVSGSGSMLRKSRLGKERKPLVCQACGEEGAEQIAANKSDENVQDYIVEMSKATGIAAGVLQEATMLIGDINQMVRINTMSAGKEDPLGSLLSVLKGGTGNLPGAN